MMKIHHASAAKKKVLVLPERSIFEDITCAAGQQVGWEYTVKHYAHLTTSLRQSTHRFLSTCCTGVLRSLLNTLQAAITPACCHEREKLLLETKQQIFIKKILSHQNSRRTDRHPRRCLYCSC